MVGAGLKISNFTKSLIVFCVVMTAAIQVVKYSIIEMSSELSGSKVRIVNEKSSVVGAKRV